MIDLPADQLAVVRRLLAAHVPDVEVRAFGSRVGGKPRPFSDLDLALVGERALESARLEALRDAFSESDLPIRVDVTDWHAISEPFRKVIGRNYEVLRRAVPKRDRRGP